MNTIPQKVFCDSLLHAIRINQIDENKIQLVIPSEMQDKTIIPLHIHKILIFYDGNKSFEWEVSLIRELFRGNRIPPNLEMYPTEYSHLFYEIESHLLFFMLTQRICTDGEIEEIYTKMAKKPDSPVTSDWHFIIWQAVAYMLGCYEVSAWEYEALMRRLARSART